MPINFIVNNRSCAHCKKVVLLIVIESINAKLIFANHAYDTNEILFYPNKQNIKSVIPPKHNHLYCRDYEQKLYHLRHIIENTFLILKF